MESTVGRIIHTDEFVGKRIALLLQHRPEERTSYAVGTIRAQGDGYFVAFPDGTPPFPLEIDWLLRLDRVIAETYDLFDGADYVLSLAVGALPGSLRPSLWVPTGLIWSDDE